MMWMMAIVALFGCDADRLGVSVSQGGPGAIKAEQIKRDLWKMTDPRIGGRIPGTSGARLVARYRAERMEAGGLEPAFGDSYRRDLGKQVGEMVCGVRRGSGDQAVLIITLDPGIGTLSVVPSAGLLSLVEAVQRPQAPMHSLYFCSIPEAGALTGFTGRSPVPISSVLEVFLLGTLTGDQLQDEPGPKVGHVQSRLLHSGPLGEGVSDRIGELDYTTIRERIADVYSVVSSVD